MVRCTTSKELAKMMGYTESTLCDVLKGRNRCERRMRELSEALGLAEPEQAGNHGYEYDT